MCLFEEQGLLFDLGRNCFASCSPLPPSLQFEVNLQSTDSRPVCLCVRRPSGTCEQFFFLLEISFRQLWVCYFVAPSLTRGLVRNLLYNCFWALPEQSLLGRSSAELTAIFYCLVWDSSNLELDLGVGVLLAADSQSPSSSGYRDSLWDPWPDFILLFFLRLTITLFFFRRRLLWRENWSVVYSAITY
jgi:hypothetical protein